VGVSLGGGGDVFYTFNTTTGILTQSGVLATKGYDDDALIFDSNSAYAYIGRYGLTAGNSVIASFTLTTAGALTQVGTAASGDTPYALAFDSTGGYLYSANRGTSTVSAFSIATGALTELASSPYPSGDSVSAMARDSTGSYLIAAAAGGTSDLTLYAFDVLTAGKLAAVATAANGSGTAGSVAVATTHSTTAAF
jgi:6-phosphogluconolactonase